MRRDGGRQEGTDEEGNGGMAGAVSWIPTSLREQQPNDERPAAHLLGRGGGNPVDKERSDPSGCPLSDLSSTPARG